MTHVQDFFRKSLESDFRKKTF